MFGPLDEFHHGLITGLSAGKMFFRNKHISGQRTPLGDEEAVTAFHLQRSHKLVVRSLDDFGYLRLTRVAPSACQKGDAHAVAIEGVQRVAFAHQNALSSVIGQESIVSVALATERSFHHLRTDGQSVSTIPVGSQMVIGHEVGQHIHCEHFGRMRPGTHSIKNLLHTDFFSTTCVKEIKYATHNFLLCETLHLFLFFLCHKHFLLLVS